MQFAPQFYSEKRKQVAGLVLFGRFQSWLCVVTQAQPIRSVNTHIRNKATYSEKFNEGRKSSYCQNID